MAPSTSPLKRRLSSATASAARCSLRDIDCTALHRRHIRQHASLHASGAANALPKGI